MKMMLNDMIAQFRRPRGIALLLVVVMIAVMLPIVTDMNYEARTEFELAMNYKKKAEAQALAQSGLAFAAIVFDLQKQIEGLLKSSTLQSLGIQSFEIWDIIPFDTSMLRAFTAAGPFADIGDITGSGSSDGTGTTGEGISAGDQGVVQPVDEGDPLFEFPGDFKLEFENEDTKININLLDSGAKEGVARMLWGIVEPQLYDFLFLENTARREFVTREELIANIADWIDGDDERYLIGGDERSLYDEFIPKYGVKNARFDTINELRMVYGVDDVVFRLLAPNITIYSSGRINVSKAPPIILEALIRSYAKDKNSGMFYSEDMMREFMGKVLSRRARDGFNKAEDFVAAVREEGVELDPAVSSQLTAEGSFYRIRVYGERDGVEALIEMVVDKNFNIYFYREG
ncbi:MAG TPA: type II secretion system protein GspK [bacterium]|nr:type II secretion system protein GspK [bacterium]